MSVVHHFLAYVGPGPGLTMVWAFIALIATIGIALLSVLLWPLRILLRRRREKAAAGDEAKPAEAATTDNTQGDAAAPR